jgi:hypothetical protein
MHREDQHALRPQPFDAAAQAEARGAERTIVSAKKRTEPITSASVIPTQGSMSGASRMPKISTACESSR